MKKITAFFMISFILLNSFIYADELPQGNIVGESAILIDQRTGKVVWEKDSQKKMYPASTTKMMTAIIILENHDLDEIVTAPSGNEMTMPGGSTISVDYGEILTVEQLMYGLLVESANDAAAVLAYYHSGSIEAFSEEMNLKAIELGAKDTQFKNPHGLHDAEHYSTAYDLAMIGRYCFDNETFRKMVSTNSYVIPPTNKKDESRHYIRNSNKFINGIGSGNKITYRGQTIDIKYDIVDGIKTGYTSQAGNCLVSTAKDGNQRYISVVLNSNGNNNVYKDSRTLLDYGFENFKRHQFISEGSFVKTIKLKGSSLSINMVSGGNLISILDNNVDLNTIQEEVIIRTDLVAPIKAGQELGKLSYYHNNQLLGSVPLLAEYDVTENSLVSTIETAFIRLDEDQNLDIMYYVGVLLKFLLAFIIYRTIITTYNLRKRKKRLEDEKNAES